MAKKPSLIETHPELVKQWDTVKNGNLKPQDFTAGSNKKVWWKCKNSSDHIWQACISSRANGSGCPFCSGRKASTTNSLTAKFPEIAKQLHPKRNYGIKATDIVSGSNKKYWWKCSEGDDHEWETTPDSRTRYNQGCPVCSNHKVVESNCLQTTHPELAEQWDYDKNKPLVPKQVHSGSDKKVGWICSLKHHWDASIRKRVTEKTGCPECSNRKTNFEKSLLTLYPDLAKEWHPSMNGKLTPGEVVPGSSIRVWWICKNNSLHKPWQTQVRYRVSGSICPYCTNKKIDIINSIATTNPELVTEWHSVKNGILKPESFSSGSDKIIWWLCSKDKSHEWAATIDSRTKGRGCRFCNKGWTVENIRLFVNSIRDHIGTFTQAEIYGLFQQNGLLSMYGKGKPFIEALKTGKFPKEELDKFIEGKPSLVDDLINSKGILDCNLELEDLSKSQINEQEIEKLETEVSLPNIEAKEILKSLENKIFANVDQEAIEFFITSACTKIWKQAFLDENKALEQVKNFNGGEYANRVKDLFLDQYFGAKNLEIPKGYSFKVDGKLREPNLMQRLVAYKIKTQKRQGNWSGTGAGKTLSAVLASRVINSKFTIISCPNSVVSGWANKICNIYPDSKVYEKDLMFDFDPLNGKNNYLILNYEIFQQPNSEAAVKNLLEKYKIDFIVIDEIHYSKQRKAEDVSKRKKIISGLISNAAEKNPKISVLGMSATPVINNLFEGISLLELITGLKYDDLNHVPTVSNCMSLYQKLSTVGIRWMPDYKQTINELEINVDCSSYISDIKRVCGPGSNYVDLEIILTKARLPEIKKYIKPKTLIYTHYVKEILGILKEEIEKEGWKVVFYTSDDKSGLEDFIRGDADVLIGSSAIATGVDGLQEVCNRLIVNILPWTNAEFEQLKGRIYRQGQKKSEIDIIVPLTYANINGKKWSWCQEAKWKRIKFKKSIADACVDGVVPEGHLRSPEQAYIDLINWLKRLETGEIKEIQRSKIYIPLSDKVIQQGIKKYGEFSEMNRRINNSQSKVTHERFMKNPKEWEQYHALYRQARKDWPIVPYEEIIKWCKARPHFVIADFGCGEAKIAEQLENIVHSFDHIAINENVTACDIAKVPLEDEILDLAIFSLSLMGSNFTDYLREAYRCLKLDGYLYIAEASSRFSDLEKFKKDLEMLGFDIVKVEEKYKFTFIRAIKNDRKPSEVILQF